MSILSIISVVLIVVSILMSIAIILQPKSEGLSLMGTGGASGAKFEKRGAELVLHRATIALAAIFTVLAVAIYLFG
jgi:preprotein translocase subunit SecG